MPKPHAALITGESRRGGDCSQAPRFPNSVVCSFHRRKNLQHRMCLNGCGLSFGMMMYSSVGISSGLANTLCRSLLPRTHVTVDVCPHQPSLSQRFEQTDRCKNLPDAQLPTLWQDLNELTSCLAQTAMILTSSQHQTHKQPKPLF